MDRKGVLRIACTIALGFASLASLFTPTGTARAGTDVTINSGTVNLWGNLGNGGFTWTGLPASASYNIPR